MMTKWGKRIAKATLNNVTIIGAPPSNIYFVPAKTVLNELKFISSGVFQASNNFMTSYGTGSTSGIAVGSGGTPENENDYCLNEIISDLSGLVSSVSSVYDSENEIAITSLTLTLTNTTNTDITVREIGKFVGISTHDTAGQHSSGASYKCVMTDRTVLESPIIVPAGESSVVKYEFHF